MAYRVGLAEGFEVSDEHGRLELPTIHSWLAGAYWAQGRDKRLTERAIAHSLCFGVYREADGAQVGFARVLSDHALRAHLADVFLAPAVRGLGLGVGLVAAILAHPELRTVEVWTLMTRDAHGLYARFGFRVAEPDPGWMMLRRV